ncbi:formate dehydrogenase accessory sulfurtransferase FdhD [Sedimentibacter sp.]|uniref:formate dehydrogenase accessory sulfurtransferase FdhD n=1 Tax=Sedimentibacter sp. TaxID=1960295 RepID=UPI0028A93700|nr:formate dehydrogenase accessory sulfurtransferase FdhD [Sedimentibacter sp.]
MDTTKKYEIIKIQGDISNRFEDEVIIEYPFTIFIDDEEIITLLCTPKSLEELAIGFLYSEGYINSLDAVEKVFLNEEKGRAYVYLKYRKMLNENLSGKRAITSGCGKGTVFYNVLDSIKCKKIEKKINIRKETVTKLSKLFNQKSELFLNTGGVHSCGLCDDEKILYFEEDIGRHNALDKILGVSLIEGIDLSDKIVITSGRISSEMLIKTAKRGIPAIISRSAPTSLAIDMARELNILLIGFARGEKINVYTSFQSMS